MKLTNREKDALTEYGGAWLYYIRRSPMLLGGETDEQKAENLYAHEQSIRMQIAVCAIGVALGCWADVCLYDNRYHMDVYSDMGSELLYTVDESQDLY